MSTLESTTLEKFVTKILQSTIIPLSAGELANRAINSGLIAPANRGRSASMSVQRVLRALIAADAVGVKSGPTHNKTPEYFWINEESRSTHDAMPMLEVEIPPQADRGGDIKAKVERASRLATTKQKQAFLQRHGSCFAEKRHEAMPTMEAKIPPQADRGEPQTLDVSEWLKRNSWVADERAVLEALKDPFLPEPITPPRHPRADLYAEVCYRLSDKPQLHADIRKALNEIGDYFSQLDRQKQLETAA